MAPDATGGRDGGERYAAPLDLLASSTIHVPQLVLLMAVLEEASEASRRRHHGVGGGGSGALQRGPDSARRARLAGARARRRL